MKYDELTVKAREVILDSQNLLERMAIQKYVLDIYSYLC